MQNVFITHDPMAPDDPCAWIAKPISIFWNDQDIQWKIIDTTGTVTWDSSTNPPIVFGSDWHGSTPHQVPNIGGQPFYQAKGPGAPVGNPLTYQYTIHINVPACSGVVVVINSIIVNQPQK